MGSSYHCYHNILQIECVILLIHMHFFVSGPKKIASVDVQSKPISLEIAMVSRFDLGNNNRLKWFWIVCLFFVHTIFHLFFFFNQGLKNLIFGTATASFNPEWRNQSFSFCDLYQLEYGIVQLKVMKTSLLWWVFLFLSFGLTSS